MTGNTNGRRNKFSNKMKPLIKCHDDDNLMYTQWMANNFNVAKQIIMNIMTYS